MLLLLGSRHGSGDAVFGERLERSLGCEVRVVVEGEDGGFVGAWWVGCKLLRGKLLLLRLHLLLLE